MSAAVTTAASSAGATDVEPVTLTTLSIVSTVLRMKQPAAMRLPEPETSAVRGAASLGDQLHNPGAESSLSDPAQLPRCHRTGPRPRECRVATPRCPPGSPC